MQNYIKTILSAVQTWTKGKIKDSTADWNQNDSGADSFVKNRTHWEEKWTKVLVDNLTSKEYEAGNISKCNFIPGNKYTVIWNDITYTDLVCRHDGDYNIIADDENKYPFYIDDDGGNGLYIETEDVPYTVSIIEDDIKVHKLDKKYLDLPPNLATTDDVQEALDVANTAQTTADNKMDAINPVGTGSFSMNRKANTTVGDYSHAEGYSTTASGDFSHAEGCGTTASGMYSHAEGYQNRATGQGAHVEGEATAYGVYKYNLASGRASHAEGSYTTASGDFSHAEGSGTIAAGVTQHVQGSNNISDSNRIYAHIVGNGTSDTKRSNAHTLDWEGNAWYSGDVYVGSTSGTNRDEGSKKLATVEEVQELASQISSQSYVVQAEEPENKKLLWVDLDDDTEESELNEAIEAAISEAKAASIPVPNVAEIGQTIVVKTINESGRPVEWEVIDFPTESKWTKHFTVTLTEPVANVVVTMPEKYSEVYASINATFSSKPFVNADGNPVDGVVDAGWDNTMGLTSEPLMINVSMNQWTGAWGWVMSTPIYMPSGTVLPGIEPTPYIGFCGQKGSGSVNQPSAIYMHANKSGLHHADIKFVPRNGLQFNTGLSFIVWCR